MAAIHRARTALISGLSRTAIAEAALIARLSRAEFPLECIGIHFQSAELILMSDAASKTLLQ